MKKVMNVAMTCLYHCIGVNSNIYIHSDVVSSGVRKTRQTSR